MKSFRSIFCVTLSLLAACSDDIQEDQIDPSSYLPMKVGNYWEFKYEVLSGNTTVRRREVMDVVTLDGNQYFEILETEIASDLEARSTVYYRIEDQRVYAYQPGTIEENLYRLDSKHGDTWSFPSYDHIATMTVTVSDITLGAATIKHCKNFQMDVEEWEDDERVYTLAPGIGFVRIEPPNPEDTLILKRAGINGQEYNF
ncbi:MAG: hypothetical protein QM762_24875 [Chryseolinea sp.]